MPLALLRLLWAWSRLHSTCPMPALPCCIPHTVQASQCQRPLQDIHYLSPPLAFLVHHLKEH